MLFSQKADVIPNAQEPLEMFARHPPLGPAPLPTILKNINQHPRICIDLVLVKACFGPELIERLSRPFGVPKNYMFIGTPGGHFPHTPSTLGGVRVIL